MNNVFWFVCGSIAGIAATVLLAPAWKRIGSEQRANALRFGLPVAGALVFVLAFTAFSGMWNKPGTAAPAATTADIQASHSDAIGDFQRRVADNPADAGAWQALAGLYRQQRQFEPARAAFRKLAELDAMSADLWADYADVEGSVSGSLAGQAESFMDKALELDPGHAKALWLKASLAHEQGREAEALVLWKRLLAVLPPDSSDARLVENNMAEAEHLAGAPASTSLPTLGTPARLSGTVTLDPRFAARVKPGTALFIYAKAGAGPPVAVMRTTTGTWPLQFTLDDSMAMMPERKLSDMDAVTVEARISPSGDATAQPGDLYATSAVVDPRAGKPVVLTIAMERK